MTEGLHPANNKTYTLIDGRQIEYDPTRVLPPDAVSEVMGIEGSRVIDTVRFINEDNEQPMNVLELGVGSGIGLVSLIERVKNKRGITLYGIDVDPYCVSLSEQNLEPYRETTSVKITQADWFAEETWRYLQQQSYQVILFNPPYLVKDTMVPEEYRSVPVEMMFTSDDAGLDHYQFVLPRIPSILAEGDGSTVIIRRSTKSQVNDKVFAPLLRGIEDSLGSCVRADSMYPITADDQAHTISISRSIGGMPPHMSIAVDGARGHLDRETVRRFYR